jgi:hypothetical protein
MKQYLLGTYQPGTSPRCGHGTGRDVAALEQEMRAVGVWVSNDHLHPGRPRPAWCGPTLETVTMTDGPSTEGNEHIGGISIFKAPDP